MRLVYNRQSRGCAADNQRTVNPPCDLLVAPLRPVGASVLEGFEHQQVALPVAQQQVRISPTGRIQETFHSLGRKIRSLRSRSPTKSQKLTPHCFTFQSVFFFLPHLLQEAKCRDSVPGVPGQGHSLQQAAERLRQGVHGEGRWDGVKVLLQVGHALVVDLSHVVGGPGLLLF